MANLYKRLWLQLLKHRKMIKFKHSLTANMKGLASRRRLSREQKKEVQDFYKKLIGKKVSLYSHEYFYSRTGIFAKEYVPTNLYYTEILPKANRYDFIKAYADKNMLDNLFPGERLVYTYLKNINGTYYYERKPVTREKAIELCSNLQNVIIKPSISKKGLGVQCISMNNGIVEQTQKPLGELFKSYHNKNFLIQERLVQHESMAALNPSSVNTLRILTYLSDSEVLLVYAVVRIGRKGEIVDNQSAGGISAAIDAKGQIVKYAIAGSATDNVEKTDSGVVLEGYKIPSYEKAIDLVKRLHWNVPYFRIVGWDVAIDKDAEPVLIEWNQTPGLSQSAFGSGFGEYTERIIKEVWPLQNSWFH